MAKNQDNALGESLVADFQTVFLSGVAVATAKYEAERSEESAVNYLGSMSSSQILSPNAIPEYSQDAVARASLDAHVKKVQAQQMQKLNADQLNNLIAQDQKTFKGKKVLVEVLIPEKQPIESLWFDKYKGYKKGQLKTKKISGLIEDVLLDKNALILKPKLAKGLLNPGLKNYIVYITDVESLQPMVKLTIT